VEEIPVSRVRRTLRAIGDWSYRQRNDLIRDGLIGLCLLIVGSLFALALARQQDRLAQDLATTSEIQENLRFVRQVVIDNAAEKPFSQLNLRGASLAGLDLACEDLAANPPTGCADLSFADLTNANLMGTDLSGAKLGAANLTRAMLADAHLHGADLSGVSLIGAVLIAADLTGTDLYLANLSGADLADATLTDNVLFGVCYNDETRWPG
jgi:uncharacterized protein YjbI with pentapeptide repeats